MHMQVIIKKTQCNCQDTLTFLEMIYGILRYLPTHLSLAGGLPIDDGLHFFDLLTQFPNVVGCCL